MKTLEGTCIRVFKSTARWSAGLLQPFAGKAKKVQVNGLLIQGLDYSLEGAYETNDYGLQFVAKKFRELDNIIAESHEELIDVLVSCGISRYVAENMAEYYGEEFEDMLML